MMSKIAMFDVMVSALCVAGVFGVSLLLIERRWALGAVFVLMTGGCWIVPELIGRLAHAELQWEKFAECHVKGGQPRYRVAPRVNKLDMAIVGCDIPTTEDEQ